MSGDTRTPTDASMFLCESGVLPLGDDLRSLLIATWRDLAAPGTHWTGTERVAMARAARGARFATAEDMGKLADAAIDAVGLVAASPWEATHDRVRAIIEAIGERKYVELVGVVSSVVAIDTLTELLGCDVEPLPAPVPGGPVPNGEVKDLKRRSSWVAMVGAAGPRRALTAVPRSQEAINGLLDRLTVPDDARTGEEAAPGLTRPQVETIVLAASHANRCFWCVMSHATALERAVANHGATVNFAAFVDPAADPGVPAGRELIDLAHGGVAPRPDPGLVIAVADRLGDTGAMSAVEHVAATQISNRLTEVTGHAVPKRRRDEMRPTLETLGALDFPHSGVTVEERRASAAQRALGKLKGRLRP